MKIAMFFKALLVLSAVAMVAFFLTPTRASLVESIVDFAKFEGLAFALSVLIAFASPMVFGVQKGEKVLLLTSDPLTNRMVIQIATALENAKVHHKIKISLGNGQEVEAKLDEYPGIITPAKVSLTPENAIRLI